MKTTLNNVQILRISTRNAEPDKNGQVTAFVSILCLDGYDTHNLWAFATDLDTLPEQGSRADIDIAIRAKNGQNGPRLSLRALAIRPTRTA